MVTEQGLYEQVLTTRRKNYKNKKEKEKTKNNFQEKSAISIRWFDLDHEWLEMFLDT